MHFHTPLFRQFGGIVVMTGLANDRKSQRNFGFTLVELLVVIATIAVLVALFLPAVRTAGPAARRSACKNNLKQIALALHNYADDYGSFPPAYTVDADGRRLHSWRTLLLPYMDHQALYERIDLTKPWDDPANAAAFDTNSPYGFRCPEDTSPRNHTIYLAVVTSSSFLQSTSGRSLKEVEGNAKQLMVIEVPAQQAVHWMSPYDADEAMVTGIGAESTLPHAGGFHAAMVDGSIEFLPADMSAAERRKRITIEPRN